MKKYVLDTYTLNKEDVITSLPAYGNKQILEKLKKFANRDLENRDFHKVSGAIYHDNGIVTEIITESMRPFIYANPSNPELFPSIHQMEKEIISMTINLFHGNDQTCGLLTSGGTESLIMAALAYREWGKNKGIKHPEIIAPETIHPAVNKATYYLGIKLVRVKINQITGEAIINEVRKHINSNTVAIFGSAPNYPHGIRDPLQELGALAKKFNINFHIDACLGGFLIPFMEPAGFMIPVSDFRVEGATSISSDVHKYGYSPKGVSILMFKSQELRKLQYFAYPD